MRGYINSVWSAQCTIDLSRLEVWRRPYDFLYLPIDPGEELSLLAARYSLDDYAETMLESTTHSSGSTVVAHAPWSWKQMFCSKFFIFDF